jgi:hypothetical protein
MRLVDHVRTPNRTGRTMAAFTLGTAAQATGAAKSTILRAIRAGRISATRDDSTGQWAIEAAELFRVFAPLAVPPATAEVRDATDALVVELRQVIVDLRIDRRMARPGATPRATGTRNAPGTGRTAARPARASVAVVPGAPLKSRPASRNYQAVSARLRRTTTMVVYQLARPYQTDNVCGCACTP